MPLAQYGFQHTTFIPTGRMDALYPIAVLCGLATGGADPDPVGRCHTFFSLFWRHMRSGIVSERSAGPAGIVSGISRVAASVIVTALPGFISPAPTPGRRPGRRRCGTAQPRHRPAHSARERRLPDRRSDIHRVRAMSNLLHVPLKREGIVDLVEPRPPRAAGAIEPGSCTHLPRGLLRCGGPAAEKQTTPAVGDDRGRRCVLPRRGVVRQDLWTQHAKNRR